MSWMYPLLRHRSRISEIIGGNRTAKIVINFIKNSMEFPRSLTGKVVCLLVPEGSMGKAELESIRGWSAKAKSIGVTFRTTIAGM